MQHFRFPIVIIDEDYRSENTSGLGIRALADAIGSDHVLFGSDWPHAEGLADPRSFVDDLVGFSDEEIRLIMRDNAEALSRPPA